MSDPTRPDATVPAARPGSGPDPAEGDATPITRSVQRIVNPQARHGTSAALVTTLSSLGAVALALLIGALLLLITGKDAGALFSKLWDGLTTQNIRLDALQRATPLMLSAVAVAIGFKMNLFNIGVEGQYFIAMFFGALAGAYVSLPAPLHVTFVLVVAMAAGASWAAIAAVLKVKRGVNEVIATIMLNYIALSVIDWLFNDYFRYTEGGDLNVKTKPLPTSAWMPFFVKGRLSGFIVISLAVVVLFWIVVFKSRFGFRLRASGLNPVAARTAGISSGRMAMSAMLISGGVAGLVGMPAVLGDVHAYGQGLPDGYGFKGIAVALLGRNHPVGIVVAAVLFGFLDAVKGPLQIAKIPNSIIEVVQAIILLTVVIVNESVTRALARRTANRTAIALELEPVMA